MILRAIIRKTKMLVFESFFQSVQAAKLFYTITEIKHGFVMHQHLLYPSKAVKTLAFQAHPLGPADVNV